MSALKPSPKAVDTANKPTASWVNRNPLIAAHCRIELQNAVSTPPIRSDSQPQPWRLKNPMPSSTDSMVAPTVAEIPRSLQYATRCCCGIDMVTQHRKPASAINVNATFGCQPRTFGLAVPLAAVAAYLKEEADSIQEVVFVLFDHAAHEAYAAALGLVSI